MQIVDEIVVVRVGGIFLLNKRSLEHEVVFRSACPYGIEREGLLRNGSFLFVTLTGLFFYHFNEF